MRAKRWGVVMVVVVEGVLSWLSPATHTSPDAAVRLLIVSVIASLGAAHKRTVIGKE